MRTKALALALAVALLVPPFAEAGSRRGGSSHGRRPPAPGYYGERPGHSSGYGYSRRGYGFYRSRPARPYVRSYRYYAPPPPYYGYGYGGYEAYGYGYYPPPPPPRHYRPRVGVGIWFGF